jgi:hypothetical protein
VYVKPQKNFPQDSKLKKQPDAQNGLIIFNAKASFESVTRFLIKKDGTYILFGQGE